MNTLTPTARRGQKSAGAAVQAAVAAVAATAAAPVAAVAAPAATDNEITIEQLGKSIADTLRAEMPNYLSKLPNEAQIKSLIEAEVAKLKTDSKAITAANVAEIATGVAKEATKAVADDIRKPKVIVADGADATGKSAGGAGGPQVEAPLSWTKGNLPLHAKQLLNLCQHKHIDADIPESMLVKGKALGDQMLARMINGAKSLERGGKSLTSTGANTGDELVPTDLSAQLLRQFFLSSNLAAIFMAKEVQMPTDPFVYPLSTTRPQFYNETVENTAATASDPGTDKATLQSVRFVGQTNFSYELDEDSIIAMLPMLQMLLAEGAADAWEDALINGDTTGTHQDSDTAGGSAKLPAKAFKGFRKLALAASLKTDITATGAASNASYLAIRKLLKKYGGDPRSLVWVVSPTTGIAMQGVAEVVSMEKFGTRATIATGEIAALQGIPIVQSERVREDLNASGVYDGTTTTKSTAILINHTRFLTGYRRQLQVEIWKDIKAGTNVVVASMRKAFIPIQTPSATITPVALGYNFIP